jgi:hypothetical protein
MQPKTKRKITRKCSNGEEVYTLDEHDDDRCSSRLLHIKEERGEQDQKGGNTKKKNANQN